MKLSVLSKMKLFIFAFALSFSTMIVACGDESPEPNDDTIGIDKSKTFLSDAYENNLRDKVWYYYKVLSLWQEVIPPSQSRDFSKIDESGYIRNNYTQYFQKAEDVLEYLMNLTKDKYPNRIPETNYDWYSFLDRGGSVSSGIQETISSGLGISVFYLQTASSGNNADLYIRYVENGSAAKDAGLQRGDQILSINGDNKLDYDSQKANNFQSLINYLNSFSIIIKIQKYSGEIVEKTLNYKSFNSNPILVNDVINVDGKKVGYLLFNSFASIIIDDSYTRFYSDLENVFLRFEQQGISELIIDLRYNGGGDVETAEYMANKIAPMSQSGKIMYTYDVNEKIRSKTIPWIADDEFDPIKFQKSGNINLSKVYFLVSTGTASASELLISALKPVMNTYVIGTYSVSEDNREVADKTYGKPVGFFGLKVVNDNVELYVTSFKMYNQNGEGDYFNGLTPNYNVWEFRSFKDFGDTEESMLAAAISHIKTGSFSSGGLRASSSRGFTPLNPKALSNFNFQNQKSSSNMFKFKKR